ncbi:MAG: nucleoside kinase [Clostridia bacterium]|nr:nucleoside kinase [Clostridia bacterium]
MSNFASGYVKYINNLEQINDAAIENPLRMITEVENAYRDHLEDIARNILARHESLRICMLAGPSSSGKTTTAHLLQKYLRDRGVNSYIVSMDDFYLGREQTPLTSEGKPDYESVDALDAEKIRITLTEAITSGKISIPHFDFELSRTVGDNREIDLKENDIIIMEGLHALNPVFTKDLPADRVIKLYVSVKQEIKDINGEVISPMDIRLVRRIVRDMRTRGTDAEGTILMWEDVMSGEDKYIRPYKLSADYTVNSIHIYEPCVLRMQAIPVLRKIEENSPTYRKARELESKLMRFEPIATQLVPKESMLREFIGPKYG